jgi:hypothetical protein
MGAFQSGMDQAARITDKRMKDIERRAYAFGHSIGASIRSAAVEFVAFAGVTISVGKALESIKGAIDAADHMRDLSIRTGVAVETLSGFAYAARQTGTDMDSLSTGLKFLAKNAGAALNPMSQQAKLFDALGVSVLDGNKHLKDSGDLMLELADKLSVMKDGTEKAAIMLKFFGKSGVDLTEFINLGSKGVQEFQDKLAALGGTITDKTANAADKFNDTLDDLKTAFGGLSLQIAADLLPDLQHLVAGLVDMIGKGNTAGTTAHEIAEGFRVVGSVAASTANLIAGITESIAGFIQQAAGYLQLVGSLLTLNEQMRNQGFANIAGGTGKLNAGLGGIVNPHGPNGLFPASTPRTGNVRVDYTGPLLAPSKSVQEAQFREQVAAAKAAQEQERKLQAALGNITPKVGKTPKTGHAGKSDAERQAEQVARAIEQMTQAQKDWEAEVAQTGNPIADEYSGRLRQITEDGIRFGKEGVPADQVKAFTDRMTELATTLRDADVAKFQQEFDDQTAASAAQLQGPMAEAAQRYKQDLREIDDLLKKGAISQAEYNARKQEYVDERDSPATSRRARASGIR